MNGWRDLLREGWDGLWVHRVRSLLSGLGILFGVAAVIGILSIGEGARREQEEMIAKLGILNFQITNRDLESDKEAEKEIRRVSRGLSRRDMDALRIELAAVRVGGAREVDMVDVVPRPRDPSKIQLLGADPDWLAGSTLVLRAGRPLGPLDETRLAPVCLLGDVAHRELFGAAPALGERIRVGGTWLTVVGLFDDGPGAAAAAGVDSKDRGGAIIVPLSTALGRLAPVDEPPELTEIQVTVASTAHVMPQTALARRIVDRLHRDQPDTEIQVPLKLLEQSRAQQRLFNLVMGLIAGISLLVGGIGIMNIMLASVLERTREIGIRLAVGARPRDITLLFLVEATLISLVGGLLGVVAGIALSFLVAAGTGWSTAVSPQAVVLATFLATAEGIVFGYVPARRAARLPPMIAVRQAG